MARKDTKNIRTLNAEPDAVPVFMPDLDSIGALQLPTGGARQFPPSLEGGCWFVFVPGGKIVWLVKEDLTPEEEANFSLVKLRGFPIVGPIYYPIAFEAGASGHLVPEGPGFDVHVARVQNEGQA